MIPDRTAAVREAMAAEATAEVMEVDTAAAEEAGEVADATDKS